MPSLEWDVPALQLPAECFVDKLRQRELVRPAAEHDHGVSHVLKQSFVDGESSADVATGPTGRGGLYRSRVAVSHDVIARR